jgi:hypothetical protein
VAIVSRGVVNQSKIKAGVRRAEHALKPDVIRIMHAFTVDWQGEPSLFFRILIRDAVAVPAKLRETTHRITSRLLTEVRADELGLQCYFNFRSESEQATLREPAWEP